MAEYVALEPDVEVLGGAILACIDGLGEEAQAALREMGIDKVEPDQWYKQQAWLTALKMLNNTDMFNMVAVGMKIPANAVFPPDINSISSALASIDVAYHMNHRNGEIGNYKYEAIGPQHARLVCDNPYPSDMDYGIIYAMAQRFAPPGVQFTVVRADSPSRLKGDDRCIYDVTWE